MDQLISVIIPVYNVDQYLSSCMECICRQTYKNIEIILIDDGSTDKSGWICDEWGKEDSRIIVIHKKNGGLSDTRNYGLDIASGQYIMFVDSDDLIAMDLIEHLYQTLIKHKAQVSICDLVHCYPDKPFEYISETNSTTYNTEDALCEVMYQTSFLYTMCAKLYKKELFDQVRFPVDSLFEDVAVMYKIFIQADVITYSNAKLYGYLHRKNSITTKKFSKHDCDIIQICQEQLDFAKNYSKKVYDAALSYQVVGALRIYLNAPMTDEFKNDIKMCETLIESNVKTVAKNSRCRSKLKISLWLFRINKRLLRRVYAHVDRWK